MSDTDNERVVPEQQEILKNIRSLRAGLTGTVAAASHAAATDETIRGMGLLKEMLERTKNKDPKFRGGHLFETIVAAKENAAAAIEGSSIRTHVTHLEGRHTAPADLERRVGDGVLSQAQAKFSLQNPDAIAEMLAEPKYQGMDLLIPAEREQAVREALLKKADKCTDPLKKAYYRDAADHLINSNTKALEVREAREHTTRYVAIQEAKAVGQEALITGSAAAASAAIVSGSISIIKNGILYAQGKVDATNAIKETARDAGGAAVRGGASGVGGTVIRYGAQKAGLQGLAKANVATSIASGLVDCGVVMYGFAKGEITAEQVMEQVGQNGFSTMSSIYAGMAVGAFFGPIGAIAGSMAGYLIASNIYQSCLAILRDADLAQQQAEKIERICEESIFHIKAQREEFERLLDETLKGRNESFQTCLDSIDLALQSSDDLSAIDSLASLAQLFGKELLFASQTDFDNFMENSQSPLII